MVDPDSGKVSRASPYSGTASWSRLLVAYGAFTLSDGASQLLPLNIRFLTPRDIPMRPYNPSLVAGLGFSPFARRYLGNLFRIAMHLISSPSGTEMVQFPECRFA